KAKIPDPDRECGVRHRTAFIAKRRGNLRVRCDGGDRSLTLDDLALQQRAQSPFLRFVDGPPGRPAPPRATRRRCRFAGIAGSARLCPRLWRRVRTSGSVWESLRRSGRSQRCARQPLSEWLGCLSRQRLKLKILDGQSLRAALREQNGAV